MNTYFTDTRPEAEAVLVQLTRQAPPWRKLQMMGQLNNSARTMMMSGLRERYPHASDTELRRRLADLVLGPEVALKIYGSLDEAVGTSDNLSKGPVNRGK